MSKIPFSRASLIGVLMGACLLMGTCGCASIPASPVAMILEEKVLPRQTIIWQPVTEEHLAALKPPAWVADPGAFVQKFPDHCVIYSPEPTSTTDVPGFWRLGDAINRCYQQERSPLTMADLEPKIQEAKKAMKGPFITSEIHAEYRVDAISLTSMSLTAEIIPELAASLSPELAELSSYYSFYGLSLPNTSHLPVDCLVLAPWASGATDVQAVSILGHEILHCFRGAFHTENPEKLGIRTEQETIMSLRKELENRLSHGLQDLFERRKDGSAL